VFVQLSHWNVQNVKKETIQLRRTGEMIRGAWSLKNIVNAARSIQCTVRQSNNTVYNTGAMRYDIAPVLFTGQ